MIDQTKGKAVLMLDIRFAVIGLFVVGCVVVGLGILREVAVSALGTGTALKDLRHFALDSEQALPAYYSSLLLFLAAGMLFVVRALVRQSGGRDEARWLLLAVVFLAMSVDEAVSFHEVLIEPLRTRLGLGGILYFSWVVPGAVAVGALGLYLLPFLVRLPSRTAWLMLLSGTVYVGGALGLELVGGVFAEAQGMQAPVYLAIAIAEEALEIAGITLFIATLLNHIRDTFPAARLGLATAGVEAPGSYERMLASRPARRLQPA